MTPERLDTIRGAAETRQWSRDAEAAEMMLELLAEVARLTSERDFYRRERDAHHELQTERAAENVYAVAVGSDPMSQTLAAAARARRERDEARAARDRFWSLLCETVEALGRVAPEAAPFAPGWATKMREERDRLAAALAEASAALDRAAKALGIEERPTLELKVLAVCEMASVCQHGADTIGAVNDGLRAEVERLTRERDDARAQIDEAQRAVGPQVRGGEPCERVGENLQTTGEGRLMAGRGGVLARNSLRATGTDPPTSRDERSAYVAAALAWDRLPNVPVMDRDKRAVIALVEAAEERGRAEMRAERDRLAAALAEVREAAEAVRSGCTEVMSYALEAYDGRARHAETCAECAADRRLDAALAATPADLAAARDARVRAEALREAAVRMRFTLPEGGSSRANWATWLRSEADRIERGGR